jgi:hypothetical protein
MGRGFSLVYTKKTPILMGGSFERQTGLEPALLSHRIALLMGAQ